MNDGKEFSNWAEKGQQYKNELVRLVDADTRAFNQVMDALPCHGQPMKRKPRVKKPYKRLPKKPLRSICRNAKCLWQHGGDKAMAETGNPNSISDAGGRGHYVQGLP
jgi:glutamate formiminotransferase/formiminotetrahydrofolate cyclodeaminase